MFCNRTVRVAIYGRRNIIHNAVALIFIVIVLKRKSSFCYSRKMAKTELYNVQQEKEEMVRRRESERKRDLK